MSEIKRSEATQDSLAQEFWFEEEKKREKVMSEIKRSDATQDVLALNEKIIPVAYAATGQAKQANPVITECEKFLMLVKNEGLHQTIVLLRIYQMAIHMFTLQIGGSNSSLLANFGVIDLVKEYNNEHKDNVIAIMLDTKGPEVRSGDLPQPVILLPGQEFTFTIKRGVGTTDCAMVARGDLGAELPVEEVPQLQGGILLGPSAFGCSKTYLDAEPHCIGHICQPWSYLLSVHLS